MPKRPTAEELEAKLGVPLPERYRQFLEDGELEHFAGTNQELKTYDGPLQVRFKGAGLDAITFDDTGLLPLATLGDDDSRLLMVDPKEPECPVVEWDDQTGEFKTLDGSLDAFLESLHAKKSAPKKPASAAKRPPTRRK